MRLKVIALLFSFCCHAEMGSYISPLSPEPNLNSDLVKLGEKLFHDTRLSDSNTISCSSCHNIQSGGDDGLKFSKGFGGRVGGANAPTVFNTSKHLALFWDGRAKSLEEQVNGPIEHPNEMASSWSNIVQRLNSEKEYRTIFEKLFAEGLTAKNIRRAIVEFEKSLVTINSAFDKYLKGDKKAISTEALEGFELFKKNGCVACHQGEAVGGNMYQRFGILENYLANRQLKNKSDLGRYNFTGQEEDRYVFKVPSLRNVDLTAPYFHDGSAATLQEAIRIMARVQLGRHLSTNEVTKIEAFLKTLTGEIRHDK